MSISFDHKLVHVHIPKNAGSTINAMTPCNVFPKLPYNINTCCCKKHFHCGAALLYRNYIGECNWSKFRSFALLRNPWDRLVSGWKYCAPDMSFESFVSSLDDLRENPSVLWHAITTQTQHITDNDGNLIVKKLGKVENLNNFMMQLSELWGFKINMPKRLNATIHGHYSEYYNDELIALVSDRFHEDIELGNYKYGE